jgi:hypothetical protein
MINRLVLTALAIAMLSCSKGGSPKQPEPKQQPEQWGSYLNRPLALQDFVPPDGRRFSLLHEFSYVDQSGRRWEAPTGLITDGASIPTPFWSVIGGPFEGLFREAAVVHDAGCCAQMQPWEDVHHMFYNAMRCSGVEEGKAKTMFSAVWSFGPRWTHLNTSMPAECKIAQPSGTPQALRLGKTLLHPEIATGVFNEIGQRTLTVPEARAVARPFFTRKPMTDADALKFVAKLKRQREITPAEQQAIALSVIQSELVSDEEVKATQQWIEKENPSLEAIEARAEEVRKKTAPELRLFPQVGTVKQSVQEFHRNLQ